ncbi:MAG TPA: hypothetical protein VKU03_04515, partial [Roseiarcus sp.]|nr:hypothetical protein [Roseiarcus sp.]
MNEANPSFLRQTVKPPLSLHIPEPKFRPGQKVDFSGLRISEPGEIRRPPIDVAPRDIRDLADGVIRVMNDRGEAVGPWDPKLSAEVARRALRYMMTTRA